MAQSCFEPKNIFNEKNNTNTTNFKQFSVCFWFFMLLDDSITVSCVTNIHTGMPTVMSTSVWCLPWAGADRQRDIASTMTILPDAAGKHCSDHTHTYMIADTLAGC
jgi:hypothetical protein